MSINIFPDKEYITTFNLPIKIPPNTPQFNYIISASDYDFYIIRNIYLTTSTSWYNVSNEIGNNSITVSNRGPISNLTWQSRTITNFPASLNSLNYSNNVQYYTSSVFETNGGTINFTNTGSYLLKIFQFTASGSANGSSIVNISSQNSLALDANTMFFIIQGYKSPLVNLTATDQTNIVNSLNYIQYGSTLKQGTVTFDNNFYNGIVTTTSNIGFDSILSQLNNSAIMSDLSAVCWCSLNSFKTLFQAKSSPYFITFNGTTNVLFGFSNSNYLVTGCLESESVINIDSNGQYSNLKINFRNFAGGSFVDESQTLISVVGSGSYGTRITSQDAFFQKEVPRPINVLSFDVCDNDNGLLLNNDAIYIRAQVDCYRDKRIR